MLVQDELPAAPPLPPPHPPPPLIAPVQRARPCSQHEESRDLHLGPWAAEGSGSSSSRLQRGKAWAEQTGVPSPDPSSLGPNHRAGCKSLNL